MLRCFSEITQWRKVGRNGSKGFMGTVRDGLDAIYVEGGGIVSARGWALLVVRRGMGKVVPAGERLRLSGWYWHGHIQ